MSQSLGQAHILVVDDDPALLDSYAGGLSAAGFVVSKAQRGADALRLMESSVFDVVVSDLKLPDLDGLTLARRVRERASGTPVILLSDSPVAGALRRAVALSALELLEKPVLPEALGRVVSRAFRRRAGLVFDNRKGEEVTLVSFNASEAKNAFGRVLETALRDGATVIKKHDEPRAVLLSWEEFNALAGARRAQMDVLTAEFDGLLARLQTPAARKGMKAAFEASPDQLGKAAAKAARKRGG
jgi:antitoxin Phd